MLNTCNSANAQKNAFLRAILVISTFCMGWTNSAYSEITRAVCEELSFNNLEFAAPDETQAGVENCVAHAVAPLYEEQLCRANPDYCGKTVSRTLLRAFSNPTLPILAEFWMGQSTPKTMNEPLKRGYVCLTEKAKDFANFTYMSWGIPKKLAEIYQLLDNSSSDSNSNQKLQSNLNTFERFMGEEVDFNSVQERRRRISEMQEPATPIEYPVTDDRILLEDIARSKKFSYKEKVFIQEMLLSNCVNVKENMIRLKKLGIDLQSHTHQFVSKNEGGKIRSRSDDIEAKLNAIRNAHRDRNSLVFGICFAQTSTYIYGKNLAASYLDFPEDACGEHFIAILGVRWNSSKNLCEMRTKNTWGDDFIFRSDWYNAEHLLASTIEISYFTNKSHK